jgi:hypothetical protein
MNRLIKLGFIACLALLATSCALVQTSMSPEQVYKLLPTMTESRFMTVAQADEAVEMGQARYLARREYVVPLRMTAREELRKGAKGIDEWVELDGGNAYVLITYKWVNVAHGEDSATQLHLEFDTMLVE